MSTAYEILGVEPSSMFHELKKAYFRKAIILHPDKNKDEDTTDYFKSCTMLNWHTELVQLN
jgi:curved DNA-binding protein CbpA